MNHTLSNLVKSTLQKTAFNWHFGFQKMSSTSSAAIEAKCIFCKIVRKDIASNILFEDDNYLVFPDHSPAALHHYLVIPKRHVVEIRSLTKEDIPMVREMETIGLRVLNEQGGDEASAFTGFHWPIHTVSHLHMHILSPSVTGVLKSIQFSRIFFGSTELALDMLDKK